LNAAINGMAVAAFNRKVIGYLACLLGLCVLFYYGTLHDVKSRHQSVLDEGVDVSPMARSRPVERVESAVVLPVKDDTSQPDYVDNNPVVVHRIIAKAQVSIDKPLDPDADPGMFYAGRLSPQENTGVFLDVDGENNPGSSDVLPEQNTGLFLDVDAEPNKQSSSESPAPQHVGAFLDVDGNGSDSHFDAGNEPIEVNTGKYLNPDGV
jgi:hypothetical protein